MRYAIRSAPTWESYVISRLSVCVQGLNNSGGSGATGPEILLESEKLLWSPGD